jgi:hypothetical protein
MTPDAAAVFAGNEAKLANFRHAGAKPKTELLLEFVRTWPITCES